MNAAKILSLFCLSMISACSSLGQLDESSAAPSESESVFIMGVSPENYRVSIFPGSIDDGRFSQNLIRPAAFYGAAKQGFIVGKANAGDVLGITNVRVVSDGSSLLGADFKPCDGTKTMVYEVPRGKIVYFGSVDYKFEGKKLLVQYKNEIAAAQVHIRRNFPLLKGAVEPAEIKFLPSSAHCNSTIYIPIYR
ncbi:hypothetical protein [Paracidovorax avenae]|uniref:hypothetical protein n=1 Tax=Paracidovorax avenae TaxID=80867 RepID=UPI0012FD12E3|nr:hypothetical protein [Paracidovorax avenae]